MLQSVKFIIFTYLLVAVNSHNRLRHQRDAEENEHHLLNILKDHEVIPDIIDDASHADTLEASKNNTEMPRTKLIFGFIGDL